MSFLEKIVDSVADEVFSKGKEIGMAVLADRLIFEKKFNVGTDQFQQLNKFLIKRGFIRSSMRITGEDLVSPGVYYVRYSGVPLKIESTVDCADQMLTGWISVSYIGRGDDILNKLVRDASAFKTKKAGKLKIVSYQNGYHSSAVVSKRSLDTVILEADKKKSLRDFLDDFASRKKWHEEKSVPYKAGILLHGPPGNGKTSLAKAIASHMSYDLYRFDLSTRSSNYEMRSIDNALGGSTPHVLCFDDVDRWAEFVKNESHDQDHDKECMSSLLAMLDGGVGGGNGSIMILTANHPNRLPKVMLRSGRIDLSIHVSNATEAKAFAMALRFYPDIPTECAREIGTLVNPSLHSMSDVERHILRFKESYREAARHQIESGNSIEE